MYTNDYVVIDLETTGLSPKYEKIIEIGAVRIRNGEVSDTFSTFVNPGKSLPPRITELTGINDAELVNAPYIEEILDEFLDFIGDDVLMGHNLLFDYSFIKKAAVNQKKTFEKDGIDTLRIARCFLMTLESKKLGALCEHYGIELNAHRALNDAIATHELYQKLVKEFYSDTKADDEKRIFMPKKLLYTIKKESPITAKQCEQLLRLAQRYDLHVTDIENSKYLEPVENVLPDRVEIARLTKNEASRLIDRLLSNFGR